MDMKPIVAGFVAGIAGGFLASVVIVRLNLKLGADK